MLQSLKSAANRMCLRCAQHDDGHDSPEEKAAATKLLGYFGQTPKQPLDRTDHGITAVTVRLISGQDKRPHVDVWIGGAFEESESIRVSPAGVSWRWADHEDDNTGRWSTNLAHSHFAEAVAHLVRNEFGEKFPQFRETIRASALDGRQANPQTVPPAP